MEEVAHALLARIRDENLNVYRASAQRLREDVGQESQIAQDYRGRLIYELLQNADDAMSSNQSEASAIAFVLDDNDLWVANSGRPLDGADVRGLCGISASSKKSGGYGGRASIGHKGMGFKSVLEITDSPEVYSTTTAFRFGPSEALRAVETLIRVGIIENVNRAPVTRFPWPVDSEPQQWKELRARGMNTAFRFPLPAKMTAQQRDAIAVALQSLPVTSLVFLKHLGRVEVVIRTSRISQSLAWTVNRYRIDDSGSTQVSEFSEPGTYRVALIPDDGIAETFLLAYESQIEIGIHRGGLDEVSWDGVTLTEVSVAARMRNQDPSALNPAWRKFHVFLPTGEPSPYDLLVSGAFNSNLSRQEIRVESEKSNYNRFLLGQVARTLRDVLIPRLLSEGSSAAAILRLLDRKIPIRTPCATIAAQVLYEEVCATLNSFPLIPSEANGFLSIHSCVLPPLISDTEFGPALRRLLPSSASFGARVFPAEQYCNSNTARVLVDHGAYCLTPEDTAIILAQSDPLRSKLDISESGKVFVDPVLNVLELLWTGLSAPDKDRLAEAARHEALFPVGMAEDDTARRISTTGLACFYPPRALHGEVPLAGLCFLLQEICWGSLTPKERNQELKQQLVAWQALFDVQEFKFPVVMRASVLPALDLDRDGETRQEREELRTMERIAAICQLAGRTSNPNAPLPYERLGTTNRALFNLSRLDLPCRGAGPGKIEWIPAYKAYFGQDWIGDRSVECFLTVADANGIKGLPQFHFVVPPSDFSGLLEKYRGLREASDNEASDIGADEVSVDEDEEAAVEIDDQSRWHGFLQWLGVNQSLRPVHFHDVEDRASGWLRTTNLSRPEGWIFKNIRISSGSDISMKLGRRSRNWLIYSRAQLISIDSTTLNIL